MQAHAMWKCLMTATKCAPEDSNKLPLRAAGVGSSSLVSKVKTFIVMNWFTIVEHFRSEAHCRPLWRPWLRSARSSPPSSLDPWPSPPASSHSSFQVEKYYFKIWKQNLCLSKFTCCFFQRQRTGQCRQLLMTSPSNFYSSPICTNNHLKTWKWKNCILKLIWCLFIFDAVLPAIWPGTVCIPWNLIWHSRQTELLSF